MKVEAVLVSLKVDGNEKIYKTSGLLFNSDMVLITGTSLIPFVQKEKWISLFVNSSSSELRTNKYIEKVSFRTYIELKSNSVSKKLVDLESTPAGVWKCPLVAESLKKLFYDWTFGRVNSEYESDVSSSSDDIEMSKELMSVFILLKCKGVVQLEQAKKNNKLEATIPVLLNLMLSLQKPNRGQEVEVVSTPFGNELFMNSLSRGVLSNVVGCQNCVILSDARTVSGCEGGPIFVSQSSREEEVNQKILGIVTCSLTWWRGEWVGFTIGVSLLPILKSLLIKDITKNEESAEDAMQYFNSDISLVKFIDETVVLIRSKASWGSGSILSASSGVIITCSHVVNNDKMVSVFQKGNHYYAEVVYKSQDDLAYDLAIIKIKNDFVLMNEASFLKHSVKVGEKVIAAGFSFFSERDDVSIRPSVALGCIARVNPYMIQTTCCVQSGFSGGPLLRDKELIGIIISNTRDSAAGALFPHINFIVPSSVFKEPVLKYIRTNDPETLKDLNCLDSKVQALWKLEISKL